MTEQLMQHQTDQTGQTGQTEQLPPAEPIRVPWATVPRVNLMPIAIVAGRRFKRTQRVLGGVVVTGIAICAAGAFLAQQDVSRAGDELTQAQQQVFVFQGQAAKYAAVPATVAKVEAARAARTSVMDSDVLWYRFLNDLEGALPAGVTQNTVTLAMTPKSADAASAATGTAGPLSSAGVGTLTVTGEAGQYRELSAWLDALERVTGVASPALTSATKSADGGAGTTIEYSITAVVSNAALSHRYDKEGS